MPILFDCTLSAPVTEMCWQAHGGCGGGAGGDGCSGDDAFDAFDHEFDHEDGGGGDGGGACAQSYPTPLKHRSETVG